MTTTAGSCSRVDVGSVGRDDAVGIVECEAGKPDNIEKPALAPDELERHLAVGIMPTSPARARLSMDNLGMLPKSHPSVPDKYDRVWCAQMWGHDDGPAVRALWSWSHRDGWVDHPTS